MEKQDYITVLIYGILIAFIELYILITLKQLRRVSVAKIGAVIFQGQWSRVYYDR